MSVEVLRSGLLTTVQDLGRYGYQKHGVIVSGAMDSLAMRLSNLLVGNAEGEAVLEITLLGPTLRLNKDTLLAITGGDLSPEIDGLSVPMRRPVWVKGGSILKFGACRSGCRAYVAFAGGFDIPEVMGSKSTYMRAGLGGYEGRALKEGDQITIKEPTGQSLAWFSKGSEKLSSCRFATTSWSIAGNPVSKGSKLVRIRATKGSQYEFFTSDSRVQFFNETFKVSAQSDRMGYRLSGVAMQLTEKIEMISEAVALGTVQVPPDGNPIILLADRQTVGGYPRIAQVAVADIPLIAQLKPGDEIQFEEIALAEAEQLYRENEKFIQEVKTSIKLRMT
ncbi:biotin-dependent carboxyltransferase family protein [Ammoniphilus sp. YIM 78166]|uniref:5-oxoprolinase subunit C family protein n=1 Tax=Ammoniphilus sp. YIM 78166 TaxID=1644106 RepID=UPI00106F1B77|nr:biotin-dependent carboxyltransferase family protein [Ammoniphilus sp. YIM 78166]